jgi:hypothetical protein
MENRNPLFVIFIATLCFALAGCTSMLPTGVTATPTTFESYAQAQVAAERIVAFQTRVTELRALGFDPDEGENVTLIPYPEILARLVPYSGVPLAELDDGIRKCILAKSDCRAYLFHFARQDRKREGNFWGDFLNVQRVTNTTGWWFESLVVVSGGVVLFRNHSGQAHIVRTEKSTNPLGPLQGAGEAAGAVLIR